MTTQDYLKVVVDNLRLAVQARKQEIDDLRQALSQKDQTVKDQMKDMKLREARSLYMATASDDDATRATQMRDAHMLRSEESRVKSNFDQYKRDMDNALNLKQRNYDDLNKTLQTVQNWLSI